MSHMSHMSLSESCESYKSHCLGLLSKYQEKERRKKKEEELASTRPVGFATGKKQSRVWEYLIKVNQIFHCNFQSQKNRSKYLNYCRY